MVTPTLDDLIHMQTCVEQKMQSSAYLTTDGVRHTDVNNIINVMTQYFGSLFSVAPNLVTEGVLDYVPSRFTEVMNDILFAPYMREEADRAIHQMHPHEAPGHNDMNPFFYQKF